MITLRQDKGSALTYEEVDNNFNSMMGGHNFLHIQDQKAQGASGGTFEAGAWRTRDLNTVLTNTITGASLAVNQITLPAGKYYCEASAFGYDVLRHRAKLAKVSPVSADILLGTNEYSGVNAGTRSFIDGYFQIDSLSVFELQHRCSVTRENGLGPDSNWADYETFSDIRIWRIGNYVA